jgi:hypothetical protein
LRLISINVHRDDAAANSICLLCRQILGTLVVVMGDLAKASDQTRPLLGFKFTLHLLAAPAFRFDLFVRAGEPFMNPTYSRGYL